MILQKMTEIQRNRKELENTVRRSRCAETLHARLKEVVQNLRKKSRNNNVKTCHPGAGIFPSDRAAYFCSLNENSGRKNSFRIALPTSY